MKISPISGLQTIPGETEYARLARGIQARWGDVNYRSLANWARPLDVSVPSVDFRTLGTSSAPVVGNPLTGPDMMNRLALWDYFSWQQMQNLRNFVEPVALAIPNPPAPVMIDVYSPIPFGSSEVNQLGMRAVTGSGRGSILGRPGQGTHDFHKSPDNWQSDNAVDVSLPVGTPIRAVADAVVSSNYGFGNTNRGGALAGNRLHLEYGAGQVAYYAHLSRIVVQPGQRVRVGDVIGYSGSANGAAHLHFATKRGDPLNFINRGKRLPY